MIIHVVDEKNELKPISGDLKSILVTNDKGQDLYIWDKEDGLCYRLIDDEYYKKLLGE